MEKILCERCKSQNVHMVLKGTYILQCYDCYFQWDPEPEDIFFALKYDYLSK